MNYFQKRELEWQKQQIKDDKRRMAEIKTMMVELQDAIQEEIERNWYVFSSGQGISMEEAYKRSNELDVVRFAKKAKKYVKNRDFSSQANKELKLYNLTMRVNRLELLKANIGLELIRTFDEIDKYVSNELTTVAKEEMKRQAGILYIDVSKNEYTSMLKQIANGSFQGVEFSNLIWSYQNELKADLSKLLQRSIVLGRNPKMLAPELKKYLTEEGKLNAKFNTQRLMVSETTNIQIAIQKQSYLDAGIEKYGYNAEPNACSVCAKLKDKTFLVSEMMPGKNAPSMHPFCRCSTYPVFEIEHAVDELKTGKTGNNGKNEKVDKVNKDELNSGKGRSIIELEKDNDILLYRKKENVFGFEPMPKKQFLRKIKEFKKIGGLIQHDEDTENYLLNIKKAEGVTYNGYTILLPRKPSRSAVYEELFHAQQFREGKIDGSELSRIRCEIEAQKYLLHNAEKLNFTAKEIELTKKNLDGYENDLKRLLGDEKNEI